MEVYVWKPHIEVNCKQCEYFQMQERGGRPAKARKNRGRPKNMSCKAIAGNVRSYVQPCWKATQPLQLDCFISPVDGISLADLQCSLCECIVDGPIQIPCRCFVCADCIVPAILHSVFPTMSCSSWTETRDISLPAAFSPLPDVIVTVLESLLIQCKVAQCTKVVALKHLRRHISSGCQNMCADPSSPSKLIIGQVIERSLTSPPTLTEQKAASKIVRKCFLPTFHQVIQLHHNPVVHCHFCPQT